MLENLGIRDLLHFIRLLMPSQHECNTDSRIRANEASVAYENLQNETAIR
jgi:hypothetical protein